MIPTSELHCDQSESDTIYKIVCSISLKREQLELDPQWLFEKAIQDETSNNWADAYIKIKYLDAPKIASAIRSDMIYKIKEEENGKIHKTRLSSSENQDKEKDEIRKDSSTAQFVVILLDASLLACSDLSIGLVDIKRAYLQSWPIKKKIYARPPREYIPRQDYLWKLQKLLYGIKKAGRQ